MTDRITVWTYDWVPPGPRGYVRDIRLRWALEEAGLRYEVAVLPFDARGSAEHLARQPFAQIPFMDDGDVRSFESGACLLRIAEKSDALMPRDAQGRADAVQWVFAALNSIEMVAVPWWFINLAAPPENPLAGWMKNRFERLSAALDGRDWLASRFTVADIAMADALRMPDALGQLDRFAPLKDYVARACARPAFEKALRDQIAHFEAADRTRSANRAAQ